MKKIPCEIIQDLLPLYVDDVCSIKSKILVEEHMKECQECRKYYASLKGEIPMMNLEMKDNSLQENEVKFFKKVKHELAVEKYLFTALVVICILFGVGIAGFLWFGALKPKVVVQEDYQGPNLPLSLVSETEGIVADREIEVDYSNYDYGKYVGENSERIVSIKDQYVLTNTTDEDKVLELAYGFVGDYGTPYAQVPSIKVDGDAVADELIIGRSAIRYDASLNNREGYEALLSNGIYLKESIDAAKTPPEFSDNVYVYKISNIGYINTEYNPQPAYGKLFVTFDPEKTEVYSVGFDTCEENGDEIALGFTIPVIKDSTFQRKEVYLVVVGDELQVQDLKYYHHMSANKELDVSELEDCNLVLEEHEAAFDSVLNKFIMENKGLLRYKPLSNSKTIYDELTGNDLLQISKQNLADTKDYMKSTSKYPVLLLENFVFSYGNGRVCYKTVTVTVPANGSVEVTVEYDKYTGIKRIDDAGYDGLEIMSSLGSNLEIENQKLKIIGLDQSIISEQTTGDEVENGQFEVELDEEYFEIYLEVPERERNPKRGTTNVIGISY